MFHFPPPSQVAAPVRRPGILRRIVATLCRSAEIRHHRRMLQVMPDHMLKDIGISRSDVDRILSMRLVSRRDAPRSQE